QRPAPEADPDGVANVEIEERTRRTPDRDQGVLARQALMETSQCMIWDLGGNQPHAMNHPVHPDDARGVRNDRGLRKRRLNALDDALTRLEPRDEQAIDRAERTRLNVRRSQRLPQLGERALAMKSAPLQIGVGKRAPSRTVIDRRADRLSGRFDRPLQTANLAAALLGHAAGRLSLPQGRAWSREYE